MLTLWGSRELLKVSGLRSGDLGSWSETLTCLLTSNFLLGWRRVILRDKEVQKPPEGAGSCSASSINQRTDQ